MVPRLSYNVQRDFSLKASIFGYAAIAVAILAAIIGTILTKCRIPSSKLVFLSNPTSPGHTCNATAVYRGQRFGGNDGRSAFIYSATKSFSYSAETISDCYLQAPTTLMIMGSPPPTGLPRLTSNHTIDCLVRSNPQRRGTFILTAAGIENGLEDSAAAYAIWNSTISVLTILAASGFLCDGKHPLGFRAYDASRQVVFTTQKGNALCPTPYEDVPYIHALAELINSSILADFATDGPLNILPDMLYPCSPNIFVWASPWYIFWSTYTAAAATISPALIVVIHILRWSTGTEKEQGSNEPDKSHQEKPLLSERSSDSSLGVYMALPRVLSNANPGHLHA